MMPVSPGAEHQDEKSQGLARQLRLDLAVRHWVRPLDLLDQHGKDEADLVQVLDKIAMDTLVDVNHRPGQWLLQEKARLATLISASREEIEKALEKAVSDSDPIAKAISDLMKTGISEKALEKAVEATDLSQELPQTLDHASALRMVLEWHIRETSLSEKTGEDTRKAAALLSTLNAVMEQKRRSSAINSLTQQTVAQKRILKLLTDHLLTPPREPITDALDMPIAYLWGVGGAGKSTILAAFEKNASDRKYKTACIHLDFDTPELASPNPLTLTRATIEQLAQGQFITGEDKVTAITELKALSERQEKVLLAEKRASQSGKSKRTARFKAQSEMIKASTDSLKWEITDLLADILRKVPRHLHLVVILDTLENAETLLTGGSANILTIENWLTSMFTQAGHRSVGVLAANRLPRNREAGDQSRMWFKAFRRVTEIERKALNPNAIKSLLKKKVPPDSLPPKFIRKAARTLPGNPLLVRYASENYAKQADLSEIKSRLDNSIIDAGSAERYLRERLLKHIPDVWARDYALAAMTLPGITEDRLNKFVMEAILTGQKEKWNGKQLFNALQRASWFFDAPTQYFMTVRPEVLRLAFPLVAAWPEAHNKALALHQTIVKSLKTPKTEADILLRAYHLDALSRAQSVQDQTELAEKAIATARKLKELISAPSPSPSRRTGRAAERAGAEAPPAPSTVAPRTIRQVEQLTIFQIEAAKLIEIGESETILNRWRSLSGQFGDIMPPDAVWRAIADLGETPADWIEPHHLAEWLQTYQNEQEVDRNLYRAGLADVITLFTGYHQEVGDPQKELDLLFDALPEGVIDTMSSRDLDALIVADLLSKRPGLDLKDQQPRSARIMRLGLHDYFRQGNNKVSASAAQFFVFAREFRPTGEGFQTSIIDSPKGIAGEFDAILARTKSNKLPITLRELEDIHAKLLSIDAEVTIDRSVSGNIGFLRGLTPEFHRPLSHGLYKEYLKHPDRVKNIQHKVLQHLDLRPTELTPTEWTKRLEKTPQALLAALVPFLDRARHLRSLTDHILTMVNPNSMTPEGQRLRRSAQHFNLWDDAFMQPRNQRPANQAF